MLKGKKKTHDRIRMTKLVSEPDSVELDVLELDSGNSCITF